MLCLAVAVTIGYFREFNLIAKFLLDECNILGRFHELRIDTSQENLHSLEVFFQAGQKWPKNILV